METTAAEFREYLKGLEELEVESPTNFNQAIPGFVEALGYDMENVYFDVSYEPPEKYPHIRSVDAAIKGGVTAPIWMTISTNYNQDVGVAENVSWPGRRGQLADLDFRSLKEIHSTTETQYSVALSNHRIAFYDGYDFYGSTHSNLDQETAETFFQALKAPKSLPKEKEGVKAEELERFHKRHLRRQDENLSISINTDNYSISLDKFWECFQEVRNAQTSTEKGKSLEKLAGLVFKGFPYISIREKNLRTSSAEIDLVLAYTPPDHPTVFDEYGRYFLVECKNWSRSVGANVVRDFKGKMDSAKVDLGIIVASDGITGRSGQDAVDELNQYFQRDGVTVVVIDESDLESLIIGKDLYEILEGKIFNRRFRRFV